MRKFVFVLIFAVMVTYAFAQEWKSPMKEMNDEITAIIDQNASTQLAAMTIGDLERIAGELSIVHQKYAYIEGARIASFVMPGMGQFKTGNVMGGSLFLLGNLAVTAGTLAGAYFLLPTNVTSLDYLNTPIFSIRDTWKSNNVIQYLPSVGVMAGGMLVSGLLRWLSASNAALEARENVATGKVTFQPRLEPMFGPMMGAGGRMGMGMMMRY
jgi:hypothetical protein